jgi:hypothetical protein
MKARVIKAFAGVKDGEIHPTNFEKGDEVSGALAVVAVEQKWAEEIKDEPAAAPEKKLDELTVEELKKLAADKGIDLGTAKLKADIVAVLEAAKV